MSDGAAIAVGLLTAGGGVLAVWVKHKFDMIEIRRKEDKDECAKELASLREDHKKVIQLLIEQRDKL